MPSLRRVMSGAALFVAGAGVSAALIGAPWEAAAPMPVTGGAPDTATPVAAVWTARDLSPKQPLPAPLDARLGGPPATAGGAAAAAPSPDLASTERQRLARELTQVRATLAALEQRVEAIARDAEDALFAADPAALVDDERGRPDTIRADGLIAAGFAPDEADALIKAEAREQLALLELRHRAGREGWSGTDRYREALAALTDGEASLRTSLDEDDYDRFLYGAGRSNRVRIASVIDGSPAAEAGLLPGDLIVRYGDTRLYAYGDLRSETQAGEAGQDTVVEVDRDGVTVEVVMPRGVLGVQLDTARIEP